MLVSEKIYRACLDESSKIGVFGHGFTYSGHPVCSAVAVEALKIYAETDSIGHAGLGEDLSRVPRREQQDRCVRPRLHLFGTSCVLCGRGRSAEDIRGDRQHRPCWSRRRSIARASTRAARSVCSATASPIRDIL